MRIISDIPYTDIYSCKLDLYLPEIDVFYTLIFFHGGGMENGDKSDNKSVFKTLVENGIAVVSVNYRMYPDAKYPEFIQDAAASVKWVLSNIASYGKSERIYIAGSSAGAYLAMMLCFDKRYLAEYGVDSDTISGFVFDSAQPTTHFNVLRERGLDTRRVIIDEAAPIYHICENANMPPLLILVSDRDIQNRLEQTSLFRSTLEHFNCPEEKITYKLMEGYEHTQYLSEEDEQGNNVFANIVIRFIEETE